MSMMASQISSLTIVYSAVYSGADQSKHQSPASLAFVWVIHQWPMNSSHKWPVSQKMLPLDDYIMRSNPHMAWMTPGNGMGLRVTWLGNMAHSNYTHVCDLPSQPDANFNTLTYIQKSLYDIGMVHGYIFINVQLFAATKQVCWYKSKQFQNSIVHPGEIISYIIHELHC